MIKVWDYLKEYELLRDDILDAVDQVFKDGTLIFGPKLDQFEEKFSVYHECKYGIGVGNCTDAITIALKALDVGLGDEVITTSNTAVPTVTAIVNTGASVRFVDINEYSLMNVSKITSSISKKTKAIIPVHLYGQMCEMDEIMKIAKKNNLKVIEDCAQAHGATYKGKKAGSIGDVGCYSFYPTKIFGAYGDGGACFTRDAALAERLRMICNHGSRKRYEHEMIGMNSRLDSIQAAILGVKLPHLHGYNAARRSAADRYDVLFEDEALVATPVRHPRSHHVFHQYTLVLGSVGDGAERRDAVAAHLSQSGIPFGIYYPKPIHKQGAFMGLGLDHPDLPVTDDLTRRVISLPMHTELTDAHTLRIAETVREALIS